MVAVVSPGPYLVIVVAGLATGIALCVEARHRPGPWRATAARVIGALLALDALSWLGGVVAAGNWSAASSLPLALCNVTVLVAAAACWWPTPLLVELTCFWGIALILLALLDAPFQLTRRHRARVEPDSTPSVPRIS